MFPIDPKLLAISESERTPLVAALLAIITQQQEQLTQHQEQLTQQREALALQQEQIQGLKDEIARLKGQNPKPKIRPSKLEKDSPLAPKKQSKEKRAGSKKQSKTIHLEIHETIVIPPKEDVPKGSRFKGYADFTVVGLRFEPHNIKYRLEIWNTPNKERLSGELPAAMQVVGGHYSPELVTYILHQHHHAHVPQGLIWEQLRDIGVSISEGQVNRILLEHSEPFHAEKEALLKVGLEVAQYIHTDDTGARHMGRNGYCTHIGNPFFTWFSSTQSKSRINFLSILRAGYTDYVLNEDALDYMLKQKLPKAIYKHLQALGEVRIADEAAWMSALHQWGVRKKRHVRIVTEGGLMGSVLSHGISPELVIISDDAGQFNVLLHALCWIHAERTLAKLVGFSDKQRAALDAKRSEVWGFYRDLKVYKCVPNEKDRRWLENRFDSIFTEKTCFVSLNLALKRLHLNKSELLLVLERPDIPLHNNPSENDIREYVMRRKRSGSTRSDLGRRCRDTFSSLKKTCRKLGISFWDYLNDRFSGANTIPQLSEIVRQRTLEAGC